MLTFHARFASLLLSAFAVPATSFASIRLTDVPDIAIADSVSTSTVAIGGEPTLVIDPTNPHVVLMALIADDPHGCAGWISLDRGKHWHGDNQPAKSVGNGDPSVAVEPANGGVSKKYLIQSLTDTSSGTGFPTEGQRVVRRTSVTGNTWPDQTLVYNDSSDKGWLFVDPKNSRVFVSWIRLGSGGGLFLEHSLNGIDFTATQTPIGSGSYLWGASFAVAGDSLLYAAWPSASSKSSAPGTARFKKSDNTLGTSWPSSSIQAVDYESKAFSGFDRVPGSNTAAVNSALSMTVDDSDDLYLVWCQKRRLGDSNSNNIYSDAQVYITKSTNRGTTWSTPAAVTDLDPASASQQWHPRVAWDSAAQALVVTYMSNQAIADSAALYASVSYDAAATFAETRIGHQWSGDDPSGAGLYAGDYFGLDSKDGVAIPVWCSDLSGTMSAYTSPLYVGGVETDSITVKLSQGATSGTRRFEVAWRTRVASDGLDKITVTPPGGSPINRSVSASSAAHLVFADSIANTSSGDWTVTVESAKGAAVSRTGTLTMPLQVTQTSVAHSGVQALEDSIQVTITWNTNVATQTGLDAVKFYKENEDLIYPVWASYTTSNAGLTHTAVCKISPCVANQYYYYRVFSGIVTPIHGTASSSRETSKRFKLTACLDP